GAPALAPSAAKQALVLSTSAAIPRKPTRKQRRAEMRRTVEQLMDPGSRPQSSQVANCSRSSSASSLRDFSRDSPSEPRTGVDGSNFLDGRKPRCEVSMAPAFQTVRTALEGLIWRFSLT